jgi:hypothetical protein
MSDMGIVTSTNDASIRAKQGRDLFDTAGKFYPPFGPGGTLSEASITHFPKHFFMVLRIVQLLRALSSRMELDFSTAKQWVPLAEQAVQEIVRKHPELASLEDKQ